MTRAQLQVTGRFALTYWHWSNASLSDRNPGADFVGASVRLRSHYKLSHKRVVSAADHQESG